MASRRALMLVAAASMASLAVACTPDEGRDDAASTSPGADDAPFDDPTPVTGGSDGSATDGATGDPGEDATGGTMGDATGGDTGGGPGGDPPPPSCETNLDPQLGALGVPGLSAGVVADGALHCVATAGMANIEAGLPVDPDVVFTWASVSKVVTATAVMVLVDDGAIALDDDVGSHLSFQARNPGCPAEPITIRQLLTHTSSIVDDENLYDSLYTAGDSPLPLGTFTADYLDPGGEHYDADTNFADDCPGASVEYSNIAIGLLGTLVQQVSGLTFDAFCRQRIFDPLGMTETSFHLANLDETRVAMPYDGYAPDEFEAHGHFGFPTYPDGLLRTSVPHLARFLAMTANFGEYDGQRILSIASATEMRRVQDPELDDTQALGWYVDFDRRLLGHNGSDPGTSSVMFFDLQTGAGALLVANGDWYDEAGEAPEARALLLQLLSEVE
ncbi:MAG: serine hydrolase domain-containing protein [Myxococcota bacterium]